ncbi:MAG: hypothetical protein K2Q10_11275 [Rhodospirillales bacterium]|nr:hypothetical protein [Rhodospirillales bacterium]
MSPIPALRICDDETGHDVPPLHLRVQNELRISKRDEALFIDPSETEEWNKAGERMDVIIREGHERAKKYLRSLRAAKAG